MTKTKSDWIAIDKPETARKVHLYLTRSGKGGYILKVTITGDDPKPLATFEKTYPKKQFNEMRYIVRDIMAELRSGNFGHCTITNGTNLIGFSLPAADDIMVKNGNKLK